MHRAMNLALARWLGVTGVALLSTALQVFAAAGRQAGTEAASPVALPAPSEVASLVTGPRLLGRGKLRYFGLLVYEARLWAGAGFSPARYDGHAFALELEYARSLD